MSLHRAYTEKNLLLNIKRICAYSRGTYAQSDIYVKLHMLFAFALIFLLTDQWSRRRSGRIETQTVVFNFEEIMEQFSYFFFL